jgi:hypothetical protein
MKKLLVTLFVLGVLGLNVFLLLPGKPLPANAAGCAAASCLKKEVPGISAGLLLNIVRL